MTNFFNIRYAKIHIPIIASVSEHQPTTWVSFFFDLHILVCTFPAGLWFCIKNINDERVFVALYAISAVYFAGVMVRLMLTLTPVVCMLSAIAFSSVFEHYLGDDMKRENPPVEDSSDEDDRRSPGNLYDKVRAVLSPSAPLQRSLQMCAEMNILNCAFCSFSPLLASKLKS